MNAAHVKAEAAINTRKGLTVDFSDFAMALHRAVQTPGTSGQRMEQKLKEPRGNIYQGNQGKD